MVCLEKYSHRFESQISIIMWLSYSRMNSCYFTLGTDDDLFKVVKGQWSLTFLWQCSRIYFLLSSLIFFFSVLLQLNNCSEGEELHAETKQSTLIIENIAVILFGEK